MRMTFDDMLQDAADKMQHESRLVHTEKWQGVDISKKPEMATHEVRHYFTRVIMPTEDLDYYRMKVGPNLPWADDHFEERVCGQPINPGIQWAKWPWGHSASNFLDKDGKFNHNYMERYWPKRAGYLGATQTADDYAARINMTDEPVRYGIYHPYGDLRDVVNQLAREPFTRQCIFPVWFPEDTGVVHGGRVPCSLLYQFFMRDNQLDVTYVLRSCDFLRHFRDDIYLTVRLALWVLDEVRKINPAFKQVEPGDYVMLITSLHVFRNDYFQLFGRPK